MAAKKAATKKTPAEKKPSLDIKDEMLYADCKGFDWLASQTEEMAKTFSPLVAMKWQSVVQNPHPRDDIPYSYPSTDDVAEAIRTVNEVVNVNFWELSKFPDLQWRLMCAAGTGQPFKHGWVNMATARKKVGKIDQVFLELYANLSDEELSILRGKYDADSFKQLLLDMAKSDAEIKDLMTEFKKNNG